MALGVIAARRVNGWADALISTLGLVFCATPSFWFGLMGIFVFAVWLDWVPAGGFATIASGYTGWARILDIAWHLVLPTATLALIFLATYLRIMRASMLEVSTHDFVRTARAKGLPESKVILKHAVRNALIPILTVLGLTTALLISGAVVTETVFGLPGVGSLVVSAVLRRDYPVIQGALLVIAAIYVLINLLIDLLYLVVDPRVRY
ncbi:hypothetical protein G6F46_013784 [Rhizopus delemar]|nr:hypothetical protein G6F46_013784 [Rhizopus delemar]